jgi:hypothetical protein
MTIVDDVRSLDPVAYIRLLGLQPEDSYGFVPMKLDEGSSLLYLYRDRPEYEEARPKLPPPEEAQQFGPVRIEPTQQVEMEGPGGAGLGELLEQVEQLQQAYGGGQPARAGAPGDPVPVPDPEKLGRIAKLRASGAINDEEYARLRAEAGAPDQAAAQAGAGVSAPSDAAGSIVAQRLYPGMRMRSSTRQLDRFLPMYREAVGIRSEDVFGVFPYGTRTSTTGESSSTEWDDYWIVYRDRPQYAAGREAYAREMDKKGRWPQPAIAPGVGEAPGLPPERAKVKVEKDRWPRKALVVKQTGTELADSLREKIAKWGYGPEDSFGFCPNFPHSSIYFGWRKS